MTEAKWLAATDPQRMLRWLQSRASERKLKLVGCAVFRRAGGAPLQTNYRRVAEVMERFVDGLASSRELIRQDRALQCAIAALPEPIVFDLNLTDADFDDPPPDPPLADCIHDLLNPIDERARAWHLAVLRDVFGRLPFRSVRFNPSLLLWRDGIVVKLARVAHAEPRLRTGTRDPARLAVLADALEDAGCTDADLLGHLRGPGPHVRGCWAVDLILGKS